MGFKKLIVLFKSLGATANLTPSRKLTFFSINFSKCFLFLTSLEVYHRKEFLIFS